MKKAIED